MAEFQLAFGHEKRKSNIFRTLCVPGQDFEAVLWN